MATSISANAAIITGTTEIDDGIVVTEGTKQIGDGSTTTEIVITGSDADGNAIYVAGSNAEIIVNNAKIKASHDICIGSSNSNGSLIVDNGSTLDMSAGSTLVLGYVSYGDGFGDLTVKGGSTLIGGYNNFWIFNGTATFSDSGTKAYLSAAEGRNNYRTILAYYPGNEATLNVQNGAKVVSSAAQFVTNLNGSSTANLNVDGKNSSFIQTEQTATTGSHQGGYSGIWKYKIAGADIPAKRGDGWFDADSTSQGFVGTVKDFTITYICDSGTEQHGKKYGAVNNCITNISATNGGTIAFESKITYIGAFNDRHNGCTNKSANFFIDEQSSISFNRLDVYADTCVSSAGGFIVNGDMNIYGGCTMTFNLLKANAEKAVITLGSSSNISIKNTLANVDMSAAPDGKKPDDNYVVTFNINGISNMKAGQQFILFNKELQIGNSNQRANTTPSVTINIEGTNAEVAIVNGQTVITLLDDIYAGRDPLADVLGTAAWGVQKSSQAFTGTLWGGRTNAVVLNTRSCEDNKGNMVTTPAARTIAWGTAYGAFDRLSSCGSKTGADYNIYGAAMGVEHHFVSGRSIGAALGYDWGKASPFNAAKTDQESLHAAVYGRAGQWKAGNNAAVALDLSAAAGNTETELPVGSISQDNLQLDARVSYIRSISDKLAASIFAGAQYYTQEDAAKGNSAISSMQNLRTMVGAGITYAATDKTTLFAEASVHNDTMRHNPVAKVDGFRERVSNPGRLGGSITAGAAYQMNDNWTLRGSYGFEGAEHNTEHSVNAGAVYRF